MADNTLPDRSQTFGDAEKLTVTVMYDVNDKKDPVLGISFETGVIIKQQINLYDGMYLPDFVTRFRTGRFLMGGNSHTAIELNTDGSLEIHNTVSGSGGDSSASITIPADMIGPVCDFIRESIDLAMPMTE